MTTPTPDQTLAEVREAKPIKESFTNPAPAMYCCLYGAFKEKAIELGYALAVHGSLARDFDLIAVPWTETAADAESLVESLREICGGFIIADGTGGGRYDAEAKQFVSAKVKNPKHNPHGRLAWSIQLGGRPQIDLSVMPRVAVYPPEPGKLPMVGGREPEAAKLPFDRWIVLDKNEGRSSGWHHLDRAGEWSKRSICEEDKHSTREAAEQFVRECAVREANGGGEMLGGPIPSQPAATPDSPPPADFPDSWGHWIDADENHWWVFGRPDKLMAQCLDPETGFPDAETPMFRLKELSGAALRGWRKADAAKRDRTPQLQAQEPKQ